MNSSPRDPDDEIADASSLFGEESPRGSSTPGANVPIGDGYEVEGLEPEGELTPPPRAPIAPRRANPPKSDPDRDEPRGTELPEARVDEVWTRWGEWQPTILRLVAVAAITFFVVYFIGFSIGFGTAFLMLLVGGAVFVALSYPIAVTLERPVRMTPEQAVKDYYGAAAHHFPQYRRMWLLLSDTGKNSSEFRSLGEFQAYWKRRMAELRGTTVKPSTPLAFEVGDFRSDKSAGKTSIEAKYTVIVRPRGESEEPLASLRIASSLVRGPDGMWYLNSGTLPNPSREEENPGGRKRSLRPL